MVVLWDASSTSIFGAAAEGTPSCLLLVVSLRNANSDMFFNLLGVLAWDAPLPLCQDRHNPTVGVLRQRSVGIILEVEPL
jgi:hypothetical protein